MDGVPALARSRSLMQVGRYDAAIDALAPAFGDQSTEAEARCLHVQALLGKGDLDRALPAAHRAIAALPGDEWPHRLLALVLFRGGNARRALGPAAEAVRISPHARETLHVLALCQARARKRADARSTVNAMFGLYPDDVLSHRTAAGVAMMACDWVVAERHLREVLRMEPDDAEAAAMLADALRRQGRRHEAGEMLVAASRMDPTNKSIRRALGRLGLPFATAAGLGVVKVVAGLQLVRVFRFLHPASAVLVAAGFFVVVGGYLSCARVNGTRHLPEHLHRGLMADHRNYALGWLAAAALSSVAIAGWAAAAPPGQGRSPALAVGLAVFAVLALGTVLALWVGPRPLRGLPARGVRRRRG